MYSEESLVMKNTRVQVALLLVSLLITAKSYAAPVLFDGNYYEFIEVSSPFVANNNSWDSANLLASESTYNNFSGHLATINSQAENDFIFGLVQGLFTEFSGAWLGGRAPQGWLSGPEEGQSFGYTNFGGAEPNNSGYIYMNIGTAYAGIGPGQWADDSGVQGIPSSSDPVIGYFVEYEAVSAVPEPSTIWLFILGFISVLLVSKYNKSGKEV